ncbi:hypothetical protein [Thermofilum sp.]|jgi:hypothetical protein|uniref:hypothetical protein n=2 Tax=Thermofilum sp. TaxID=1961369 RepID=UPI00258425AD|nr:hypothetical protein [Thermofilum sp.]
MGSLSTRLGREIVLIDKEPEKVFIEKTGDREIHYFYWRLDLYKPFDYEPVTLLDGFLCSRYHWKGLVLWTEPVARDKPLMTFALGVHTPLVYSRKWQVFVVYCLPELTLSENFWLGFYLTIFNALLSGVIKLPNDKVFHGYMDKAVEGEVPEEYRFRLKEWTFLIIVGSLTEKLPSPVSDRLRECG